MKFEDFRQEIKNNIYLKMLFDYHDLTREDDELIEAVLDDETEENKKIISQINWLFTTNDSTYYLIGIIDNNINFIDSEGIFCDTDDDIYYLPFLLYDLINYSQYWKKNDLKIKAFIYYFDYCDKNGIKLLPEYLAWKQPLLDFISETNNDE